MRHRNRRHDQTTRRMSKSPKAIAQLAMAIGQAALSPYTNKFSPRRYTQAQLFTCLILRQFFRTDYRGLVQLLADCAEVRAVVGLTQVPHYSTLCYAQRRLAKQRNFAALQQQVFLRAQARGLLAPRPTALIDATGLEARHVSRYYVDRKGYRRFRRRRWPKVTVVGEAQTHLIAGATISWGPSQDSPQLPATVRQAAQRIQWDRLLGDTAYDAEHNHRLCREELGIRSTVIPLTPRRRSRRWPKTRYRRQMKRRFFTRVYRQRWQVESLFSRHKRVLGDALRARQGRTQKQECLMRILTHNLMILRRRVRFSTEQELL
jgi:Transposase DDE domain